jgi:four helix bundle protein
VGDAIKSYEDLTAWQLAVAATIEVYRVTSLFPSEERFGLTQQVRRAAVSVPSNIAEGYGRGSRQDYARFLRVGRGSLYEVETQLQIAVRLGYLEDEAYREIRAKLSEAGRVLAGLIRSIES